MFCVHICLYTTCIPKEARRTRVTASREPAMWVLIIEPYQPVLLTTEPTFHPQVVLFYFVLTMSQCIVQASFKLVAIFYSLYCLNSETVFVCDQVWLYLFSL